MKTILVAENEEAAIELYDAALASKPDWKLVIARDGDEAVRLALESRPDIALLDLQMPLLDGIEVCKALKGQEATANIPIVIVSASAQQANRAAAEDAGASEFVAKPFSPLALADLVARILNATV